MFSNDSKLQYFPDAPFTQTVALSLEDTVLLVAYRRLTSDAITSLVGRASGDSF